MKASEEPVAKAGLGVETSRADEMQTKSPGMPLVDTHPVTSHLRVLAGKEGVRSILGSAKERVLLATGVSGS